MNTTISSLIALEIGHVQKLADECVADILTDLPNEQIQVGVNDTTGFIFELNNKRFTLLNTGSGSLAVRICYPLFSLREWLSSLFAQCYIKHTSK